MKRSAFQILCPCAGRAAGGTSQAEVPPAGPWPYGINLQLVSESKFESASHGPRAVFVRAAETCADKSAAFGRDSGAHWAQGRADGILKLFFCPRAHAQIQTDVQTEPSDQKSVWAKHRVLGNSSEVSRETRNPNSSFTPNSSLLTRPLLATSHLRLTTTLPSRLR